VQPYLVLIYSRLRDSEPRVRKNTLLVLIHLILNDMIKAHTNIGSIALCLEDPEPRISDLARLFFHELSCQDENVIHNYLPEVVVNLSSVEDVTVTGFRNIMKFLFGYLDKEKHFESLVEKLAQRMHSSENPMAWKNIAFCLTLVNYGDSSSRKFIDCIKYYKDRLIDNEVYEMINSIIAKIKKSGKDYKNLIKELEDKIKLTRDSYDPREIERHNHNNLNLVDKHKKEQQQSKKKRKTKSTNSDMPAPKKPKSDPKKSTSRSSSTRSSSSSGSFIVDDINE